MLEARTSDGIYRGRSVGSLTRMAYGRRARIRRRRSSRRGIWGEVVVQRGDSRERDRVATIFDVYRVPDEED